MRSLVALVIVAATGAAASANTYLGLGLGTGPSLGNDTIANAQENGRSERLLLGWGIGGFAIETEANRFSLVLAGDPDDSTMLGIGLRYRLPLGSGFGLFGRAGLERTWLDASSEAGAYGGAGNGYYLGVGADYRLPILGALFVDYERQDATIDAAKVQYGQSAGMFTLGVTFDL